MQQKNKINAIQIASIIRSNGATLNSNGDSVNFAKGFQVSKKDCYILKVSNINKILTAVNKLLNGIKKGEFVGLWVDDGKIYIDISERIKNLKKALAIGKARHQISIFNWADKTCINC